MNLSQVNMGEKSNNGQKFSKCVIFTSKTALRVAGRSQGW